jgi:hypothetical protein
MKKEHFDLKAFKEELKRYEAADSLQRNKRDLCNTRITIADYLSYRNEEDDEYVYLQEALGLLPDDPKDIEDFDSYVTELLSVINQMLDYKDDNFDNNHLKGIRHSLKAML